MSPVSRRTEASKPLRRRAHAETGADELILNPAAGDLAEITRNREGCLNNNA